MNKKELLIKNLEENIPNDLKQVPNWIVWKVRHLDNGRTDKVPYNPNVTYNKYNFAKVNERNTFTTFENALNVFKETSDYNGLGFIFTEDIPYFGIDIDDHSGKRDFLLQDEFVDTLKSYNEFSVSKTGVHIIVKGNKPSGRKRKGDVEIYDSGRFFVMTGDIYKSEYKDIIDASETIKPLFNKYLTDTTGMTKMEKLEMGFWKDLDYKSQSEADMALLGMYAKKYGNNKEELIKRFKASGLYRPKHDELRGDITLLEYSINNIVTEELDKNINEFGYTDTGNAYRLAKRIEGRVKYNVDNKEFMIYDGKKWVFDLSKTVRKSVEALALEMRQELLDKPLGAEEMKQANRNIQRLLSKAGMDACLEQVKHISGVPVFQSDFDKDKFILNIKSGELNLRTKEVKPHRAESMLTDYSDVEVSFDSKPKRWLQFLDEIFLGQESVIHFMHKAVGYSLTGDTREQSLFILYGEGNNGKSVFLNTISKLAGSNAKTAQVESLLERRTNGGGSPSPDIARLRTARLVVTGENNQNTSFNEGLVKLLTGGEPITARFLHGNDFEYLPKFKIFMATNHKPRIRGTDNGIWRRIKAIPFDFKPTKEQIDKELEQKLERELPEILGWALEGVTLWEEEGLDLPKVLEDAKTEYRKENNRIINFIEDYCDVGANFELLGSQAYKHYSEWTNINGEYKIRNQIFASEMEKNGFPRKRKNTGNVFVGIKIKDEYLNKNN